MMNMTIYTYAMGYGMPQMQSDLSKSLSSHAGSNQQLLQFIQISGSFHCGRKMLYNHLHRRQGKRLHHNIGGFTGICLCTVGKGIHGCGCYHSGRECGQQYRVQNCHIGACKGIGKNILVVFFLVQYDSNIGTL